MSDPRTEATKIDLKDSALTFVVEWADGQATRVPYQQLRQLCACAVCVDEVTGERKLDPDSIPDDIGVSDCEQVGLYGLRIYWTDGHQTGIYTWDRLREIGDLIAEA